MVKFGRHLQFFLELEGLNDGTNDDPFTGEENGAYGENKNSNHYDSTASSSHRPALISRKLLGSSSYSSSPHYIVPYNILRDKIEKGSSSLQDSDNHHYHGAPPGFSTLTPASFEMAWRDALTQSNQDFSESMNSCWQSVFSSISSYQHQRSKTRGGTISHIKKISTRGMELMDAITLFTQINDVVSSRDLLSFLKDTFNAAEINYQALRKIVKKFDKKYHAIHDKHRVHHQNQHYTNTNYDGCIYGNGGGNSDMLSVILLPELYSSSLFVGRHTLEMIISYLREFIEEMSSTTSVDEEDVEDEDTIGHGYHHHEYNDLIPLNHLVEKGEGGNEVLSNNTNKVHLRNRIANAKDITHNENISNSTFTISDNNQKKQKDFTRPTSDEIEEGSGLIIKNDEIEWLENLVEKISLKGIRHVIAHRGYHATRQGRSDHRPLENSLLAFESAWSAGIQLCGCDVVLTKDEKLVLAHDDESRNGRLKSEETSTTSSRLKVSELTFKELNAFTFKNNGVRTPLLKDVLMSAIAIGPEAQLIISIQPGNSETGMALARFLKKHPKFLARVAIIMSFDLFTLHSLCSELQRLFPKKVEDGGGSGKANRHPSMTTTCSTRTYTLLGSSPCSKKSSLLDTLGRDRDRSNSLISYGSSSTLEMTLPKLMLLTVADQSENRFELCVDVSDYSPIGGWLKGTNTSLDGVFVRCEPSMLLPEGKAALQKLSKEYTVGIWGKSGEDPDDHSMMQYLVNECGVSYYNSDLPKTFLDS